MQSKKVLYSKKHCGFLVRLLNVNNKILVNIFAPNGSLNSYRFSSVLPAFAFISMFTVSLKKK